MEKLEKLENNTIVITEYPYKLDLLKKLNKEEKLFNIKFMDMKELIEILRKIRNKAKTELQDNDTIEKITIRR